MANEEVLLEEFSQFILDKIGMRFTKDNRKELEKKLIVISEELGFQNRLDCLKWFLQPPFDQKKLEALAAHLTVGETYFFRDAPTFEILQKKILPELIQRRKKSQQFSIWSAGCCTGEEIYSIAILLDQLLPFPHSWSIHLMGTDINPEFLRRARIGHYREWSLRNTPEDIKKTYFTKEGELFVLLPSIREKVEFYTYNLVDPSPLFLNQIDLILCHNVIIYFSPSHIQRVVQKLSEALKEEGWLSVSSIETPYILDPSLVSISFEGIPFFKKKPEFSSHEPQDFSSLAPSTSSPLPSPPPFLTSPFSFFDEEVKEENPPVLKKELKTRILQERAHKVAHPPYTQEKREQLKVIVFYLNKEIYAIDFKYIKEIYPLKEWTFLPHLPLFIKGVMNVRRKILSIIDLKRFFGLSNEYQSSESLVIILEDQQKEFAILTDEVEGVRDIFLEDIHSPLPTLTGIKQEFIKGFTADHLLILDGKKLLEDDRLVIKENIS